MQLSERALKRRAQVFIRHGNQEAFLQARPGLEAILAEELRSRGMSGNETVGGITVATDLRALYSLNLGLSVPTRVLLRMGSALSQSYPMLYDRMQRLPWEVALGRNPAAWVSVAISRSRLRHKQHVRNTIFDAMDARLSPFGLSIRQDRNADLRFLARLDRDTCTISFDTGGKPLHDRGYRERSAGAPIRATSAAAVLWRSRAADFDLVVDPFCGSGTIPIEAASMLSGIPINIGRGLAIDSTPLHRAGTRASVERELRGSAQGRPGARIWASDKNPAAVAISESNAKASATTGISFAVGDALHLDFASLARPDERALLVANLPYGVRLGTEGEAGVLTRRFASHVATAAAGWRFAVITRHPQEFRHPGLVIESTLRFKNGGIPVVALFGVIQ